MKYLFSTAGRAALTAFVSRETLFAFDLDGTLAPIVPDPAAIRIQDDVRRSLIRLDTLAPVAIISGRSRDDARLHLGFTPRFLVGNHGAEGLPGQEMNHHNFARLCRGWKEQLTRLMPDMAARGIVLEDKGETIALHYRQAPDPERARECIETAIARLTPPPRPVAGIFVENLMPKSAPHKGVALEALIANLGCQRAIFVGDDITDEDVFRLNNPTILGILVGKDKESAAGFYLKGQQETILLLNEIISRLNRSYDSQAAESEPRQPE